MSGNATIQYNVLHHTESLKLTEQINLPMAQSILKKILKLVHKPVCQPVYDYSVR